MLSKFVTPSEYMFHPIQKRVGAFFDRFSSPINEDDVAVCVPSYKLRKNNCIDLLSGFSHVFLFVMPEEVDLYSTTFPWATIVKRKSTTMGKCRNEIIEYIKDKFTYFMLVDDDIYWREYYYPETSPNPKTRVTRDPVEIHSMIMKNISLMDKLEAGVMFFDKSKFSTARLSGRLNLKFGRPAFQAFVFRTSIFDNPQLRYTEDITVAEDDAMNELLLYFKIKYIKAIDFLVGNPVEGETLFEQETSNTVVSYISHKAMYERVKKFREEKKTLGFLQALRRYGYPDLK